MYCFRTIQMEKVRKLETGSEYMLNVEWTRVLSEEVWIEREGAGGRRQGQKETGRAVMRWSVPFHFLSLIFERLPTELAASLTEWVGWRWGVSLALGVPVLTRPSLGPVQPSPKSRHLKVSTPVGSAISTKSISIKLSLLALIEKLMIS